MANANINIGAKHDWILANPWLWFAIGAAFTLAAWAWKLIYAGGDGRVIVLAIGLLITGVALWQRYRDDQSIYLGVWSPALPSIVRLMLAVFFFLGFLAVIALFVYSFSPNRLELRPPGAFLVMISTGPASAFAAWRCLAQNSNSMASRSPDSLNGPTREIVEEKAILFILAGGICFLGIETLYLGSTRAHEWDSMRLCLRVAMGVCLFTGALVLVSSMLRRLVLSLLFLLHFAGITTAALGVSPSPWIIQQAYNRVFRPYLEFMYLINAYHFYAPDPGPSSYLWFRLIFADESGQEHGMWLKIPRVDDEGRVHHPVALDYQRFLSITESTGGYEMPPGVYDATGNVFNPLAFVEPTKSDEPENVFLLVRERWQLQPPKFVVLGQRDPGWIQIPFMPNTQTVQQSLTQVRIPNDYVRRLLRSFGRALGTKYAVHPENPSLKFKSVKIYRVTHSIPPVNWYVERLSPTDPDLFQPFYLGNYDQNGRLILPVLDAKGRVILSQDPYLFWHLPILRENLNDPNSAVRDYCRLHAGDPKWYRPEGQTEWVEPPPEARKK